MSLDGAQLSFINAAGVLEAHSAKGRKFVVGSVFGSDLVLTDAERVHCEIQCDAYGRVSSKWCSTVVLKCARLLCVSICHSLIIILICIIAYKLNFRALIK